MISAVRVRLSCSNTWVFTDKLTAYSVENSDASVILLSKGDDVYKLAVNPSGDYAFYRLDRNSWQGLRFGTTDEIAVAGSINADADEDLGFAARVRIPWSWMDRKTGAWRSVANSSGFLVQGPFGGETSAILGGVAGREPGGSAKLACCDGGVKLTNGR